MQRRQARSLLSSKMQHASAIVVHLLHMPLACSYVVQYSYNISAGASLCPVGQWRLAAMW
jgi:hypothetical protein